MGTFPLALSTAAATTADLALGPMTALAGTTAVVRNHVGY